MRIGVVGLGAAGLAVARAVVVGGRDTVVAGADIDRSARTWFRETFNKPAFESLDELSKAVDVDAVWIATPTYDHEDAVCAAAAHGMHAVVEKPMATSVQGGQRMVEACGLNGVHLVCGGSRSSSATVAAARAAVEAGSIGRLRAMTSLAATDWLLRPRRPDECDVSLGGGVVFRQAPHVIDTFRLLAGGLVQTVRGVTGSWLEGRGTAPGYYSAILEFEDGITATCTYNGHGHFMAAELFDPEISSPNIDELAGRLAARRAIMAGTHGVESKADRGARLRASAPPYPEAEPFLADLGIFILHGEEGEIRQSRRGLLIYGPDGVTDEPVKPNEGVPELDELRAAIEVGTPIIHSGPWGLATLEVCCGIMESADRRRDVTMCHQVAVPG